MSDSRKLAVLAALFVIFGCVASDRLTDYRTPTKVTTRCCTSVTSAISREIRNEITSFRHQNALGPCVHAIIFQTKNNGEVCTDPNERWVPKKLKELQKQS